MSNSNLAPLLVVDDLTTEFISGGNALPAVRNASFSVDRGRTLGVVGESGSGKSVLIRSIMRLLRASDVRHRGRIVLDGEDLLTMSGPRLRATWGSCMAMVFQDPMTTLHPNHRIGFQVSEALRQHFKISRNEADTRTLELLRSVGIPEPTRRMRQYPYELSGGMRQRVVIAIAIACDPELLLADEPTTALDVTVQAQVLGLLKTHQSQRGMAMILVSHDLAVVSSRTDDLMVMYSGQIVEYGKTATVLNQPLMPYTAALLRSTPSIDKPVKSDLFTIPGEPLPTERFQTGCRFASRCQFASEICISDQPGLTERPDGRRYRCHLPLGSVESSEALKVNLARGKTAAGLPVSEYSVAKGA
ncbi:ABC transporter ATP-binding protein [Aeromicrobium panaciterrae]|uniref:ABC transporter ATP-binding protein n=1 Tax=Aeromicrobium panaciterrae TaxID=363861 RepID=UPI0031D2F631